MHIPTLIAIAICMFLIYILYGAWRELIKKEREINERLEKEYEKHLQFDYERKKSKRRGA